MTRAVSGAVLQGCFVEAANGRQLPVPDLDVCAEMARSISEEAAKIGTVEIERSVLGDGKKSAKKLLAEIPRIRERIHTLYQIREHFLNEYGENNPFFEDEFNVNIIEKALSSLLKKYGDQKPKKYSWHVLADFIAAYGMSAWRGDDGSAPTAVNPGDPLCQFVSAVLDRVGWAAPEDTVSAALRRRRGPASKRGTKTA